MASIISAGTTDATSLNVSSDKTGILQLASNNAVTAVTIDASQNVGIGTTSVGTFYGKTVEISNANDCALKFTNAQTGYTSSDGTYVGLLNSGNADFYINNRESANMIFQTSNTERMRIDTSGNVGIGRTSPAAKLDVAGDIRSSNYFQLSSGSDAKYYGVGNALTGIYASTDLAIWNVSAGNTVFYQNGAERMRILSSGEVAIATTTVLGSGRLCVLNDTNHHGIVSQDAVGNALYRGTNSGGTVVFNVSNTGNVTNTNNSYGAISDIKLKENIVDATPKLDSLMQVKVRNYNLKSDPTHKQLGVIAQELEQVFPAMVEESPDKDEECNELGTTTKSVKYTVFIPMLIKSIQELKAINDTQAETINALTARIEALENK